MCVYTYIDLDYLVTDRKHVRAVGGVKDTPDITYIHNYKIAVISVCALHILG